jgi:nuclear receptor interaction protein
MKDNLSSKIFLRESSDYAIKNRSYRKLYSDPSLIANLDIVNELDGHSGCVNALSWSKSGGLLASGSDDQHLNIHTYQSSNEGKQFQLACTVATGHTQNIFSVKFMPHSHDRTVITAAGDGEVRIFDLEHAGNSRAASTASHMAAEGRRRGRNNVFNGVKYMTDGDTNCRVYRSHGDRVKRIVTESSPYLFLTCSEDGEVRQWDLRQPSSAYPSPRSFGGESNVPPPLISYKRYNLDLNSISCSASQPHYIALGGAHLHAFLHDRRMAGRDRLSESGTPMSSSARMSEDDEETMAEATRCVRKFAPNGQQKMGRTENGHITALKISDARPDEMIVSWSGDHIYSFDLVRHPSTEEDKLSASIGKGNTGRVKSGTPGKRKRRSNESESSTAPAGTTRVISRPRTSDSESESNGEGQATALRIRYQNGQQEDIPIPDQGRNRRPPVPLNSKQKDAQRIARATVRIRSSLFSAENESHEPAVAFTSALGLSASILSDMDQTMRDWGYPIDPLPNDVVYQQTLRRNRESGRRFVQAAGTLARALGGKMQTPSGATSPLMSQFSTIETRANDLPLSQSERFGYDFLKAILLWLESGVGRLLEGFTRSDDMSPSSKAAARLPIPESDATPEAIDDILVPYLLSFARDKPIANVEANRFEHEGTRHLFASEQSAVLAFAAAVKIPFTDLSSEDAHAEIADPMQAQHRQTAFRFWGLKAARGVLINAAEGVNYVFVDRAFGGLGRVVREAAEEEAGMESISEGEDEPIVDAQVVERHTEDADASPCAETITPTIEESRTLAEREAMHEAVSADLVAEMMQESEDEPMGEEEEDSESDGIDDNDEYNEVFDSEDGFHDDEDEDEDNGESSEPGEDDDDDLPNNGLPRFMYRSAFERRRIREKVASRVPCSSHTRVYRGHCNVKTVKDVNFFGLDDEYIVSGSDDGNLFIWDRKTTQLVNILEGDGEVVNVAQGHPYETMLAVSGIDHTIKIFSPDARAREAARLGRGVEAHDASEFSSIAWPPRYGGRRRASRRSTSHSEGSGATSEPAMDRRDEDDENDNDDYVAPSGLASRRRLHESYQITQQNDVERQGGNQDAFITVSKFPIRAAQIFRTRIARGRQFP